MQITGSDRLHSFSLLGVVSDGAHLMTHPRLNIDLYEEYDEYVENTPLEARFDYLTIEMAVTEAFPKHEAYGMMFPDYYKKRKILSGYDDTEKRRLSFYFPLFYAMLSADLADIQHIDTHPFILSLAELGLIHVNVDYAEEFRTIKESRAKLFSSIKSDESKNRYMQLSKQTVNLGSSIGARSGGSKHFSPNVQEWLYNAVTNLAIAIDISATDMVFLSWCYGLLKCFPEGELTDYILSDVRGVVKVFDYEIRQKSGNLEWLTKQII